MKNDKHMKSEKHGSDGDFEKVNDTADGNTDFRKMLMVTHLLLGKVGRTVNASCILHCMPVRVVGSSVLCVALLIFHTSGSRNTFR